MAGTPKLIILVGPPGSGKSTWCLSQTDICLISQDLQGREGHWGHFLAALEDSGKPIVIDRMNFNKKQRSRYIVEAKKHGYQIECVTFYTPKQLCIERASARTDHPTIKDSETAKKVINFFFANFERPETSEGIDIFKCVRPELVRSDAIVCDLDGTLCNINHRLHHVREKPKRWDLFFKGIKDDSPNEWCLTILNNIVKPYYSGISVVLCSGRGEEYREATESWLSRYGIMYNKLFMRPAGDSRPDDMIKETILDFDILPQYDPLFFLDDRKRVVDMWRRRGFVCLECAEGDF